MPDPNLFHLNWERTFEGVTLVIVLAFVVERVLAVIFENRLFIERVDRPGLKELVALALSIVICWIWEFDLLSLIILTAENQIPGYFITGGIIAGGSKASIKFFHDLLGVKSTSYENRYEIQANHAVEVAAQAAAKAQDRAATSAPGRTVGGLSALERKAKAAVEKAERAALASGTVETQRAAETTREALDKIRDLKSLKGEP